MEALFKWNHFVTSDSTHSLCMPAGQYSILWLLDAFSLSLWALRPFCWTLAAFSVSWPFTQLVGLLGWGISLPQGCTNTEKKCIQTSMPQVGFKSTIAVFEWVKTVHVFDHAALWLACQMLIETYFTQNKICPIEGLVETEAKRRKRGDAVNLWR
jgi:hypothetical protein